MNNYENILLKASSNITIDTSGKVVVNPLDKFKFYRKLVKKENHPMYDFVVTHWMICENTAPKSGNIFLELISGKKINILKSCKINKNDFDDLIKNINESLIVETCYKIVGLDGTIDIVKSFHECDDISINDSYKFHLRASSNQKEINTNFSKVLVIDGYIKEVSEIHQLLFESSESKIPLLIFAKGFSDDVLNTINVNNTRKSFNIVAVEIITNEETINDLYDIALIAGGEVISPLKGQLISSIKYESIPTITYLKYSFNEAIITMKNDKTKKDVRNHLIKLKERLETSDEYNAKNILRRIKHLTSLMCTVSLINNSSYEERKSNIIKSSSTMNHYLKYGKVIDADGRTIPKSSYDVAIKHYQDFINYKNSIILHC